MDVLSLDGPAAGGAFALLLAAACVCDVRTRRIPNVLVAVTALAGVAAAAVSATPGAGALRALAAIGLGLVLWLPFHVLGMLGAGDVKFFAAAAAWIGPAAVPRAALVAALGGGVLALAMLLFGGARRTELAALALVVRHPRLLPTVAAQASAGTRRTLPYAVPMAVGLAVGAWLSPG